MNVLPSFDEALRVARALSPVYGRMAVLWPALAQEEREMIRVPEWVKRAGEARLGGPVEVRECVVVMSGEPGIAPFDIVGLRADAAGRVEENMDREVIPPGWELRYFGVQEPIFDNHRDPSQRGPDVVLWLNGRLEA